MEPTGNYAAQMAARASKKRKAQEPLLPATALGDQLACMVDDPLHADVQLLVGHKEEATPVYASKVILMARSPVFKALLGGNFREGQPPPPTSSSPSSSSSSSSSASASFLHRAEVRDMEPRTMRHLLHCLYTDQLHPDLVTSSSEASSAGAPTTNFPKYGEDATMTQQEQDLVALYAAADRYLVDKAKALARAEIVRHFNKNNGDLTHVLAAFDLAVAVAPKLAESVFQPLIESDPYLFLGDDFEVMEAQWLGLSEDAAARIVGMHLEGFPEIDVFYAIERRYRHHLAQAKEPGHNDDDWADEEDDNNGGEMDEKSEEMRRRKRKAREEAKKKVAGLIRGIKTILLSVHELRECVEPSGLFTDAQLLAAYRHAASTHRYVVEELASSADHDFGDLHAHGMLRWRLAVQHIRGNGFMSGYEVHLCLRPRANGTRLPSLSANGVTIDIYHDRRLNLSYRAEATTLVDVPGVLRVPFIARPGGQLTIIIRVPPTAFTR